MAIGQTEKLDYLYKKIAFTNSKTGNAVDSTISGTKKAPYNESIPSPLTIPGGNVWSQSDEIASTPPTSSSSVVGVYTGINAIQLTEDSTVSNKRSFLARSISGNNSSSMLGDWIDTQFGVNYLVKVYAGNPNLGGTQLFASGSGNNDEWFFDYSSGVLNFTDTNVPSLVTGGSAVWLVGYRYIGQKGVLSSGDNTILGITTVSDLTVTGNLTVEGDQIVANVVQLRIEDKNVVLGFTTTVTPSDTTANGGGISIASTEGSALVSLQVAGINTLPNTYKQITWFDAGTFGVGTTDAWISNQAIGIGSTQLPNGTLFAAGKFQVGNNTVNYSDYNLIGVGSVGIGTTNPKSKLQVSGDINIDDGGTFTTVLQVVTPTANRTISLPDRTGTVALVAGSDSQITFNSAGINSGAQGLNWNNTTGLVVARNTSLTNLIVSGITTLGVTSATNLTSQTLNVSGITTFNNTINVVPTSTGIAGLFSGTTSSDMVRITQLGTGNALVVEDETNPDASPFVVNATGAIGVGTTSPVQRFQVGSGGTSVVVIDSSANLGIGTTSPIRKVHILGDLLVAAGSSTTQHIVERAYEFEGGVLSWEGSSGSLLTLKNNLTSGSLFSINDITAIPIFDIDANRTVVLTPITGNVGIGTTIPTSKLQVVGDVLVSGIVTATDFNSSSDVRLKTNISPIEDPIEKVMRLNGVSFNWNNNQRPSIGVIAQEVEKVFPELVSGNETKTVNYNGLIALLIEVVKKQQEQINELSHKLNK